MHLTASSALNGRPNLLAEIEPPSLVAVNQNPLPTSPIAVAAIPDQIDLRLQSADQIPFWQAGQIRTGYAVIELDQDYRVTIDELESEVLINNRATGESTKIWGNAQIETEGQDDLQFWGTTTFVLENKAKITAKTVVSDTSPNSYVLDELIITKQNRAIVVSGASNQTTGDMLIDSKRNGITTDLDTPDNFVLKENANGAGWIAKKTAQLAVQDDLDLTAPGERFGPEMPKQSLHEFRNLMTRFLSMSNVSFLLRLPQFGGTVSISSDLTENGKKAELTRHAIIAAQQGRNQTV